MKIFNSHAFLNKVIKSSPDGKIGVRTSTPYYEFHTFGDSAITGKNVFTNTSGNTTIAESIVFEINCNAITTYDLPIGDSSFGTYDILVQGKNGTNTQITRILVAANGTTLESSEYGNIEIGNYIADFSFSYSGSTVNMNIAHKLSTTGTFKLLVNRIKA